ncbi:diguanylate cyclase [Fundidesulfovibrio putealis]|uniref:diguanylate cyclase n=1 Tax=Fundidesulfovibrio putealis TaxID=270496 RepID=UPI0003FFD3DE|nr:diguanylate cyclase [Fundidesulfovibrio putealis]
MRFAPVWNLHAFFRIYGLTFSLLPCALTAVFLWYFLSDRLHSLYLNEIRQTLTIQGQFLDTWISYRQRDIQRLAEVKEVVGMDLDATDRSFRQFLAVMPEFRGLGLIDANGRTVVDTVTTPGLYLGDRAYFRAAEQGKSYISDVLVGRATGTSLIIFASPVMSGDGAFRGVIFAPVSLDMIEEIIRPRIQFEGRTLLLDKSRKLISGAQRMGPGAANGMPHPASHSIRTDGESFTYKGLDGEEIVAVALPLDTLGWVLVGEVKAEAMRKAVRPVLGWVLAAGGVSFLLALPLLFRMARQVESVVMPLARHARGVAGGNYSQPPPEVRLDKSPLELRVLAEAYETMRAKILSDMNLLETLALTDDLTRLPNRRCLMEEGLRLLEISARAGNPCSCMIIDVDHFKDVNDRLGHAMGDQVLAALATVFRESLRGADLLGRLGGEEFLVICTNTDAADALHLADRLRQNLRGITSGPLADLNITVSIGVATLTAPVEDAPALFDRLILTADMAMYQAKTSGRDKVVLANCDPRQSTCNDFII